VPVSTINLTPIVKWVFLALCAAVALFLLFLLYRFVREVVSAPFRALSNRREGKHVDEFDELVLIWGSVALVVALIIAAFYFHLVAFE
jgi:hypothetical protein